MSGTFQKVFKNFQRPKGQFTWEFWPCMINQNSWQCKQWWKLWESLKKRMEKMTKNKLISFIEIAYDQYILKSPKWTFDCIKQSHKEA